jgi:SSS family solute:Na+ symporter
VGFAAILVMPGLKNGDKALLSTVRSTFSPWFLGVVGGTRALTAMVPAAILILTAGTLFAKNFFRPLFAPSMTDDGVAKLAKIMVVVITAIAMYFAIFSSTMLVGLLLFAYSGVTQFFPGVVLGLFWKRATAAGVAAGIITGVGVGMVLVFSKHDPYLGLNPGFIALCLNAAIATIVSLAAPAQADGFAEQVEKTVNAEFASYPRLSIFGQPLTFLSGKSWPGLTCTLQDAAK